MTTTKIELTQETPLQEDRYNRQTDLYTQETGPCYKSPMEKVSIFGFALFSFMFNTMRDAKILRNKGKCLDENSTPGFPFSQRPEIKEKSFLKELEKQKRQTPNKKPSLAFAVFSAVKWEWFICLILQSAFITLRIFLVWVAKKLLESLSDSSLPASDGYKWAGILGGCVILISIIEHHYAYKAICLALFIRSGLISMLYTKVSKLSATALNKISVGKIVNIIANDVNVFERTGNYVSNLVIGVFGLIGSTALLWTFFGASCLVGIGSMILQFPIQAMIAKASNKPRNQKNEVTDDRVKRTNEVIEGIRLLKMYTWELIFRDTITKVRHKEINALKEISKLEGISRGVAISSQAIAAFLTWLTYALTGHDLTVSIVFPSVFLIGIVRLYFVLFVAFGLSFISEAKLLMKRIQGILDVPETNDVQFDAPLNPENAVEFDKFTAYWSAENTESQPNNLTIQQVNQDVEGKILNQEQKEALAGVNLEIKKGTLNALIGKVGSGKSSFLLSFTGEMPKTEGSLRYQGKIAYVEQEPTIFSGTLRDNILFGKEYDPEFYNKVIKGCSLVSDLQIFPNGDLAEIGEKGINLSGGQKARLALARAVYSDADIYLLDDPLSAVDVKVAKNLYNNAIRTLLKGKTVILATHQVHFIKNLESIIVMDGGRVLGAGAYEALREQNINIDRLFSSEEKKQLRRMRSSISKLSRMKSSIMKLSRMKTLPKPDEEDSEVELIVEEEEEKPQEVKGSEPPAEQGKLFSSEDTLNSQANFSVYKAFFKNMGPKFVLLVVIPLYISNEVANVAFSLVAGEWANGSLEKGESLGLLGGLAALIAIIYIAKNVFLNFALLRSSGNFHDKMLDRILKNPVQFFDTNPVGRILNRFTNDIGVLDRFLPTTIVDLADQSFYVLGMLIAIAAITPYLLIPIVVALLIITILAKLCFTAMSQTRDFDLKSKSPLYSLLSSSLDGITVIQVYKQSNNFVQKFRKLLHIATKGSFSFWSASRCFGFYVDLIYNMSTFASVFIITELKNSNPALSGISLSFLLSITGALPILAKNIVQTDVLMASTARVQAYCETPSEAALTLPEDNQHIQAGWPQKGEVKFDNVYMKYRANTDHVIRDLTLHVKAGEKIGCVGRTGAGKSSILQILFRMVEIDRNAAEGSITIDGVDTKNVGLHVLRNNLSIIPQTPFIFTGSVKRNLDPLGKFSDEEIWSVLEDVDLREHIDNLENKLETDMTNASSVFSVGQKQLICLARAILKQSKVLVLDEATANVDLETDGFIQDKIMEKFSDCTIFTIAHRLYTVAHYDKVLVLDKSRKVEFDEPYRLLVKEIGDDHISNESGHFASMVLNTGPKASQHIFRIAKDSYFSKHQFRVLAKIRTSFVNYFSAEYSDTEYDTYVHIFEFPALEYGQVYQYTCYPDTTGENPSQGPFSFYVPNPQPDGSPVTVVVFGDFGATHDGQDTMDRLNAIKDDNFTTVATYIHMGDLAYDLESKGGQKGDDFMNAIQDFATSVPYMISPGNHETLNNFSNVNMRFKMPYFAQTQNHYYSYNIGNMHFASINLDLAILYPELLQYMAAWLENDLAEANANRDQRPWIIMYTHRPLYCSQNSSDCNDNAQTFSQIVDIINTYKVDLYLSGHVHAYERMLPIYHGQVAEFQQVEGDKNYNYIINPQVPIYIVQGMAGHSGDPDNQPVYRGKDLSVEVDMKYSVMSLTALNNTHLYAQDIHSKSGHIHDFFYLIKGVEMEDLICL